MPEVKAVELESHASKSVGLVGAELRFNNQAPDAKPLVTPLVPPPPVPPASPAQSCTVLANGVPATAEISPRFFPAHLVAVINRDGGMSEAFDREREYWWKVYA